MALAWQAFRLIAEGIALGGASSAASTEPTSLSAKLTFESQRRRDYG